jgi:hypothetical protein
MKLARSKSAAPLALAIVLLFSIVFPANLVASATGKAGGVGVAPDFQWIRQFGSPAGESSFGVSTDSTGAYVVGVTCGTLPGQVRRNRADVFIRKYGTTGTALWTSQFGSGADDTMGGVVADKTGVYVVGNTRGALPGKTNLGSDDAFIRKYSASGSILWTKQFGTSDVDVAYSVATDSTGVYITGYTLGAFPDQTKKGSRDAFIRKYNSSGDVVWTRQFGTSSSDTATGVAADSTGVYIVGSTSGVFPDKFSVGGVDSFIRKYSASGHLLWTRQFGTPYDEGCYGTATGGNAVYVVGYTCGTFPGNRKPGGFDAYVAKYSSSGGLLWTKEFGTVATDYAKRVAAGSTGVYIAGETDGTLPDQTNAGSYDAFLAKLP